MGVLLAFFTTIISCEEDFTNIGSNVISNTKFNTSVDTAEITVANSILEKIKTDNITREPGQYLLGVYASADYEKLEASIISQIAISTNLALIEPDTIVKYQTV